MTKPDRILLIDADVLAYQAAASVEHIVCWDGDNCFPMGSLMEAVQAFFYKLGFIEGKLLTMSYVLCFSCDAGENFRKSVFHEYKANRAGKPRPVVLKELRKKIMEIEGDKILTLPTLEADDVMGIRATMPCDPDVEHVVVTIDKDLKSIPGHFFNLGKPDDGIIEISEHEADRWFMMQALMGDMTDNYPGCPGFGPRTAAKLLDSLEDQSLESMWDAVVKAYEKKGFGKDYALQMARLARILRAEDWDEEKQEVKLWTI